MKSDQKKTKQNKSEYLKKTYALNTCTIIIINAKMETTKKNIKKKMTMDCNHTIKHTHTRIISR